MKSSRSRIFKRVGARGEESSGFAEARTGIEEKQPPGVGYQMPGAATGAAGVVNPVRPRLGATVL